MNHMPLCSKQAANRWQLLAFVLADLLAGRASWMEQAAGVELARAGELSALHPLGLGKQRSVLGTVSLARSLLLSNTAFLPRALLFGAGVSAFLFRITFSERGPQAQPIRTECASTQGEGSWVNTVWLGSRKWDSTPSLSFPVSALILLWPEDCAR